MEKKLYLIKNRGCDDTTTAVLELTQKEVDYLTKIFETINKNSEHCCQPTIHIDINAQLVELDSKYKNADEYYNETNDYGADIVEQNGKLYKW